MLPVAHICRGQTDRPTDGKTLLANSSWPIKYDLYDFMVEPSPRKTEHTMFDDIKEWCRMNVYSASILAQSRAEWRHFVGCVVAVVDTNGH